MLSSSRTTYGFIQVSPRHLDQAWKDIATIAGKYEGIDILYVSYMEATHGAPKSLMSSHLFRPVRGRGCGTCRGTSSPNKVRRSFFVCYPAVVRSIFGSTTSSARLNVFATRHVIVRQEGIPPQPTRTRFFRPSLRSARLTARVPPYSTLVRLSCLFLHWPSQLGPVIPCDGVVHARGTDAAAIWRGLPVP